MSEDRHIALDEYKTSFDLPEVITARMRLAYRGAVVQSQGSELFMIQRWQAFRKLGLFQNWQSELWPSLDDDILEATDPRIADLVIACVNSIFIKMSELESIEKK